VHQPASQLFSKPIGCVSASSLASTTFRFAEGLNELPNYPSYAFFTHPTYWRNTEEIKCSVFALSSQKSEWEELHDD
jgi:hypothetical protein